MITAQSDNFQARLDAREGQPFHLQAFIEGVPDVACTHEPADKHVPKFSADIPDSGGVKIRCGTNTALTQLVEWTILLWIKPRTFTSGDTLAGAWDAGGGKGFRIYQDTDGSPGAIYVSLPTFTNIRSQLLMTQNAWNFVCVGVGGDDGIHVMVNDTIIAPRNGGGVTKAGRNSFTGGTEFIFGGRNSVVGYCAVFNRGLTYAEMRMIRYRFLTSAWGDDDGGGLWDDLVAQWSFTRGKGVVVNDKTPGTHNGTFDTGIIWGPDLPYTVTYWPALSAQSSFSQEIEPIATKASISGGTIRILDTDAWFTTVMANLGLVLQGKRVRLHMGFMGQPEDEYQPVYTGVITNVDYEARAYQLSLGDPLVEGKKRLQLGRSTLNAGITNVQADLVVDGSEIEWHDISTSSGYPVAAAYKCYLKIDSEIARYQQSNVVSAGELQLQLLVRGQFGTTGVAHSAGAVVEELFVFDNVHPLTIALILMLSGNDRSFLQYSCAYDDLPTAYIDSALVTRSSRGMGLSPSEVAIAEIESLRDVTFAAAAYRFRLFVVEDTNDIKDFVEKELLAPLGCFFFTKSDGRISIGSNKIPVAASSVRTLDPSKFFRAKWRISYGDIVNHLEVQADFSPATGNYDFKTSYSEATSGGHFHLKKREFTFHGVDAAVGTMATILANWATDIFTRFAEPYKRAEITCPIFEMLIELFDPVTFTDYWLPNFSTGQLGVHKQLWQVVKRTLDYGQGQVVLELADLS